MSTIPKPKSDIIAHWLPSLSQTATSQHHQQPKPDTSNPDAPLTYEQIYGAYLYPRKLGDSADGGYYENQNSNTNDQQGGGISETEQ